MSDIMLLGVLRQPFESALSTEVARRQYWQRGKQAAAEIERLQDEVERLEALIRAQVAQAQWIADGWQPIETAPRDGTKVMIWLVLRQTIAWAQWQDADEYYGILTNPARWEWQDGGIVSWVPDHPGAVSHWATLEPPPTGGTR